jgi:hypothetical protein
MGCMHGWIESASSWFRTSARLENWSRLNHVLALFIQATPSVILRFFNFLGSFKEV